MMKYLMIIVLFLSLFNVAEGQQMPQFTQYMFNDFVTNPAVAGTKEYYQARSNTRYQWVGIVDAPRTYMLSAYGPDRKYNMGYGGYAFNDVTGPTSRTGLYGSYSYNFKAHEDIRVSLGLSFGILQYKVDGSKVILHDDNDPSFGNAMYVKYMPDATFGGYVYASDYYGGFGISQMFGNKIDFKELTMLDKNSLTRHLFVNGGYFYQLNDDIQIEPSAMIKGVLPVPMDFDIAVRGIYKELAWFGVSFRTGIKTGTTDAVSILIGYNHENQLIFGYSYDITLSDIHKYSSGTHELMIGLRFNKIKQSVSRAKIY